MWKQLPEIPASFLQFPLTRECYQRTEIRQAQVLAVYLWEVSYMLARTWQSLPLQYLQENSLAFPNLMISPNQLHRLHNPSSFPLGGHWKVLDLPSGLQTSACPEANCYLVVFLVSGQIHNCQAVFSLSNSSLLVWQVPFYRPVDGKRSSTCPPHLRIISNLRAFIVVMSRLFIPVACHRRWHSTLWALGPIATCFSTLGAHCRSSSLLPGGLSSAIPVLLALVLSCL